MARRLTNQGRYKHAFRELEIHRIYELRGSDYCVDRGPLPFLASSALYSSSAARTSAAISLFFLHSLSRDSRSRRLYASRWACASRRIRRLCSSLRRSAHASHGTCWHPTPRSRESTGRGGRYLGRSTCGSHIENPRTTSRWERLLMRTFKDEW